MHQIFCRISIALAAILSVNIAAAQQLQHPVALSANSGSLSGSPTKFGGLAPDSRGWTDPALNHNKLIQQQNGGDGTYKLIGTYKVIGTQFLFGEYHKGDMFAKEVKAYNVYLSYNTYNQEVEFYSTSNPDKPLVREPGTLDSFTIQENASLGIRIPLKFVYGSTLGAKDQYYYMEIYRGIKFSLYKRYKSGLDYVSNNLAQPELRQFDLHYEYYYTDAAGKGVKKIKPNAGNVIKEFKSIKDLSSAVNNESFTSNPEQGLINAFTSLNN